MFRKLAQVLGSRGLDPFDLFSFHPHQLTGFREAVWEAWRQFGPADTIPLAADAGIGHQPKKGTIRPPLETVLHTLDNGILSRGPNGTDLAGGVFLDAVAQYVTDVFTGPPTVLWHHLIYAYMIESTCIVEVFERVLREILTGEKLGTLSAESQRWARNTEALFFSDGDAFSAGSITSSLRPDPRATRRNAYHRMFGTVLDHPMPDGRPYVRGDVANKDFIETLESLFREVWRGYINVTNTSGQNTTDDAFLADVAARLGEMLKERRLKGALTREEFNAVATMSWFHFTVDGESDQSPIVADLRAHARTPEERLRKIGERVGVATHAKSRSLFRLAENLSPILIEIERGTYDDPANVRLLYDKSSAISDDMVSILNDWHNATGRDLKATQVTTVR